MWDAWLDLALGSRCVVCEEPGRVLCRICAADLPRSACRVRPDPEPEGLAPTFAAGPYADPLRSLVIAHKEHRVFALARPLGAVLAEVLADILGAALELDGALDLVLIPVPSSSRSVRSRGHDPVGRMVAAAAADLRRRGHRVMVARLLRQSRTMVDQAGLDATSRAANLAGSLAVDGAAHRRLSGRARGLVLCDDIVTTGATAREAQRALAAAGIPITAIAAIAATRKEYPRRS
jgi:predicted amidophosphoribosyltransferase